MRKSIVALLLLCLVIGLAAGCGGEDAREAGAAAPVDPPTADPEPRAVDVDLTALGKTMVYAEVYDMMTKPDRYLGKTIRMRGLYAALFFEDTGEYSHFVIIEDATACCQSGLEFVWNGDHAYPDDYPAEWSAVELEGVFESYEELGETYFRVATDDVAFLG